MDKPKTAAEQEHRRHILNRVGMLREVACRLIKEHERLTIEARTISIQLLTLEQELAGDLPASAPLPIASPVVNPLRT
jgi:hypothetical protein